MSPMFDRLNTPRRRATRQLARARLLLGWGIKQGVHPNASLVMAILMALIHIPQGMSQNATLKPEETISIVYGYVTHHYLTSWKDRNLPAGVLRGLPPNINIIPGDKAENAGSPSQAVNDSGLPEGIETAPEQEAAILYQLDLGERGMQMMVSTKTGLKRGHCIALERQDKISNLRRVSPAFCKPENQMVINRLESMRTVQANHCLQALRRIRESEADSDARGALAEIQMLCDGG